MIKHLYAVGLFLMSMFIANRLWFKGRTGLALSLMAAGTAILIIIESWV